MPAESTTVVIFGGYGDLARRKLVPALFELACKDRLPQRFRIVGVGRREYTDASYRAFMEEGLRGLSDLAALTGRWAAFAQNLFYSQGDLDDAEAYLRLKRRLEEVEGGAANRLFYLSVAPRFFGTAVENLGDSGLAGEDGGWRRVVIEKPFGHDLRSAMDLNRTVHRVFEEEQVYRIDHYLGKETVQNLLVFRFSNAIFEPVWNRNYIDNVQITAAETNTAEDRAGYYDRSGVLRDMVQNHLLQLLTMVAMEPPSAMDSSSLRNSKVEALRAIRRWDPVETAQNVAFGQYQGYQYEQGVAAGSTTATYAALRMHVDNWRWQGVPFYLRTGKALATRVTEVVIQFRRPPLVMFTTGPGQEPSPNLLSLRIQPDEGVHLRFGVKVPDRGMLTESKSMEFRYDSAFTGQAIPEAYERLLQDSLEGDASLFIRSDHIEEAWRIVDPILNVQENRSSRPPHPYEPGSWGPEPANGLLSENGHSWQWVRGTHGGGDG